MYCVKNKPLEKQHILLLKWRWTLLLFIYKVPVSCWNSPDDCQVCGTQDLQANADLISPLVCSQATVSVISTLTQTVIYYMSANMSGV